MLLASFLRTIMVDINLIYLAMAYQSCRTKKSRNACGLVIVLIQIQKAFTRTAEQHIKKSLIMVG